MSISEEIKSVVESQLTDGQFLVDVVVKGTIGTQKLIILVDSDKGMTIESCGKISRSASKYLEENELFEGAYTLEVSSPGLDHPLKLERQYLKNIGRNLRIQTVDNQQFEGKLKEIEEGKVKIELSSGKKDKTIELVEIPFTDIDKAMVLVSFNKQG
jgi:ribosome maturation factor RimP